MSEYGPQKCLFQRLKNTPGPFFAKSDRPIPGGIWAANGFHVTSPKIYFDRLLAESRTGAEKDPRVFFRSGPRFSEKSVKINLRASYMESICRPNPSRNRPVALGEKRTGGVFESLEQAFLRSVFGHL